MRRGIPVASVVLAAALLAAAGGLAVAAARGPQGPGTMEERVHAVAETLRCPVCQNLSVADSPSTLAGEMRRTIRGQLEAGRSPQEIRQGFVEAYGEWVLQSPPKRGINVVAWAAPAALFLTGLIVAGVAVRRWTGAGMRADGERRAGAAAASLSTDDRRLLERALAASPEDVE